MPTKMDLSRSLHALLTDIAKIERLVQADVGEQARALVALRRRASEDFGTCMAAFEDVAPTLLEADVERLRSMLRRQRENGAALRSQWSAVSVAAQPAAYRCAVTPLMAESRTIIHAALAALANDRPGTAQQQARA